MEEIKKLDIEAFGILEDANVSDEELITFTREDLKDLFGGVDMFLLRRKIWSIIEKARETNIEMEEHFETPRKAIGVDPKLLPVKEACLFGPSTPGGESSASGSVSSRSQSPSECVDLTGDVIKPHMSPAFIIYSDSELFNAGQNNSISKELLNRLVRSTISNMRSACQSLPRSREPTTLEIEDMARALCRKYPCLEKVFGEDGKTNWSVTAEERPNLTEAQINQLHHSMFKKLKKRWQNIMPAKRPQGKIPARSFKRTKLALPESVDNGKANTCEPESEAGIQGSSTAQTTPSADDVGVTARHYGSLDKEQRKIRPNPAVINKYLNLGYSARRQVITDTRKENRPSKIFEQYPCFKNPKEVVEEVRRSLELPEGKTPGSFMETSVNLLKENVDNLIFYGISKKVLQPPRGSSLDHKVSHLMKGINQIFKSKGKSKHKSGDHVIHFVEDGEEPDNWQQRRQGCYPGLLLTRENGAIVLLGKDIFLTFEATELANAVVSFLGCFYLLDMDYPKSWLITLSILQRIIFKDNNVHPDHQSDFNKALAELQQFCE